MEKHYRLPSRLHSHLLANHRYVIDACTVCGELFLHWQFLVQNIPRMHGQSHFGRNLIIIFNERYLSRPVTHAAQCASIASIKSKMKWSTSLMISSCHGHLRAWYLNLNILPYLIVHITEIGRKVAILLIH